MHGVGKESGSGAEEGSTVEGGDGQAFGATQVGSSPDPGLKAPFL